MKYDKPKDASQKWMKLVSEGTADLNLLAWASPSGQLASKLESMGILCVGDLLRWDRDGLLAVGLEGWELGELVIALEGEGLAWILDPAPPRVKDAYYELWHTLHAGADSKNVCLAGHLGPCIWTCHGGILTIDHGADSGVLPSSFVVEDEAFSDRWVWADLLGDHVYDVRCIVVGPGVRAKRLAHLFGWSDYSEDDVPHSFSNAIVIDLSGLDCSCVDDMSDLFFDCSSLCFIVPPEAGPTACPTDIGRMFEGCSSLGCADLSWIDVSEVKDADRMFADCTSLEEIDLPGEFGDDVRLDGFFYGSGADWRLRCRGGIDARVAEEIAFARRSSMLGMQLEADLHLVDMKIGKLARCKPSLTLQMTAYLHAAGEIVWQRFALMHVDPGWNKRWRIWRLVAQLDEMLALFGSAPSDESADMDSRAILKIKDLVQREPESCGRNQWGPAESAFDYLLKVSRERHALTAWTSRDKHDYSMDMLSNRCPL